MKNIFKGLGLSFLTLAFVLGTGAAQALAATTYAVNAITEDGALTINTAATSNMILAGASTTGNFTVGDAMTSGTITIGGSGLQTGTITLGGGTGAQTVNVGTGGTGVKTINIGTSAIGNVITIGTVTGAASMSLLVGTGNFALNGAATSTYTIGAATTSGTITIGGTAQTGTMTLGSSSGTNIVNIAAGAGASTVNIANAQVAGAVNIGAGMTTGTITIGGTGLQTGTITLGGGTGAQTLNIGTGGTGIKTINVGTDAIDNVITIGTTTGAASVAYKAGTGKHIFTGVINATSPVFVTPVLGVATGTSLAVSGLLKSSSASAGVGYATGAGCAITQITTRATGVTCTGVSGAITTDITSLAAAAEATFTVTDTSVAIGDTVIVSVRSGATNAGGIVPFVSAVAAGSFDITLSNVNASADTGAIILNFAVIKAVSA